MSSSLNYQYHHFGVICRNILCTILQRNTLKLLILKCENLVIYCGIDYKVLNKHIYLLTYYIYCNIYHSIIISITMFDYFSNKIQKGYYCNSH